LRGSAPAVAASLTSLATTGRYPGSAAIALGALDERAQLLLCDTRAATAAALRGWAAERQVNARVEVVHDDGPARLEREAAEREHLEGIFALLDPFVVASEPHVVKLLGVLASRGAQVMLWAGWRSDARRRAARALIEPALDALEPHGALIVELSLNPRLRSTSWSAALGCACVLVGHEPQAAVRATTAAHALTAALEGTRHEGLELTPRLDERLRWDRAR
jgi:23S rRNA A2030 N6-methylase RlmJ